MLAHIQSCQPPETEFTMREIIDVERGARAREGAKPPFTGGGMGDIFYNVESKCSYSKHFRVEK